MVPSALSHRIGSEHSSIVSAQLLLLFYPTDSSYWHERVEVEQTSVGVFRVNPTTVRSVCWPVNNHALCRPYMLLASTYCLPAAFVHPPINVLTLFTLGWLSLCTAHSGGYEPMFMDLEANLSDQAFLHVFISKRSQHHSSPLSTH